MRGNSGGQGDSANYSPKHIKSVLESVGVTISSTTSNDFLCFCPFHHNRDTPSLSVSKTNNTYICFNADCAASGTVIGLVSKLSDRTYFEALRFVTASKPSEQDNFEDELTALMQEQKDWIEFPPDVLTTLSNHMAVSGNAGREYMHGRGFTDDTIDYFKVGYSAKRNMVAVPVHSPDGVPLGVVGRAIDSKDFKNSAHMPTSKTLFNIHRAKRESPTAIIVEAGFDVMSVFQAGFPNAVGTLGGYMSETRLQLLDKYFDRYIIFTDNRDYDQGGKALGQKVVERFNNRKEVLWAMYAYSETYPGGFKDATEIQEKIDSKAVSQCIENAIPHYELASSMV